MYLFAQNRVRKYLGAVAARPRINPGRNRAKSAPPICDRYRATPTAGQRRLIGLLVRLTSLYITFQDYCQSLASNVLLFHCLSV